MKYSKYYRLNKVSITSPTKNFLSTLGLALSVSSSLSPLAESISWSESSSLSLLDELKKSFGSFSAACADDSV